LLDLETANQVEGLRVIASAVRDWSPERSQLNYVKSLENLDWRWRFKTIAEVLNIRSSRLDADMARLQSTIRSAQPADRSIK